jgi:hypothetical protein
LLDSFFAIELAVDHFISRAKEAKGVSKEAIENLNFVKNFTYMLKTEVPILVRNYDAKWVKTIETCLKLKDIRNNAVHRGRHPTEEEARQAVAGATELLAAFLDEDEARSRPATP